ncbi:LOW QUALITY PROTEIN: hypothetical protein Cgig2_000558 [Carnegiea gigantea]|uniref:Uncharacterized protein n=1 Tax=Carnegiea gigantea TaxID=171969 RepID=A0A9Q1GN30_9CARY|nr:LOW QUALITY PROTEIN: hypothetical protein Cgig2_000558 [Carnegiea gigantea]
MEKTLLKYARLLIDIPLSYHFPEYVEFANEKDVLIRQQVTYKWQRIKCDHCHMYGHLEDNCRKKQIVRQELRVVQPTAKTTRNNSKPQTPTIDEEGFIQGRIWVAWRPQWYSVHLLSKSDQHIHCKVFSQLTLKHFYLTFVYRDNQDGQRHHLWAELEQIASDVEDAWCVMGDFNSILYARDRMGGNTIHDSEIKPFTDCVSTCELQELQCRGPYCSWTNKTIYQVHYLTNALSDHTPLILHLTDSPKPKRSFQFYEMWIRDTSFKSLVQTFFPKHIYNPCSNFKSFWTQHALLRINKDKYHDLRGQQVKARAALEQLYNDELKQKEKEMRNHYISITSSVMDIIRQQSKAEWINFGDASTKYFFAKAKQRKLESYAYAIQDEKGELQQGFLEVSKVLGVFPLEVLGYSNHIKQTQQSGMQIISGENNGKSQNLVFKIHLIWRESSALKFYHIWHVHILGYHFHYPSRKITYRGVADYIKAPYISWNTTCSPRNVGGIGLKNIAAWNKAHVAKLMFYWLNGFTPSTLKPKTGGITKLQQNVAGIRGKLFTLKSFLKKECRTILTGNGLRANPTQLKLEAQSDYPCNPISSNLPDLEDEKFEEIPEPSNFSTTSFPADKGTHHIEISFFEP